MELTEYGKHGKQRSRLSTLPTLFGNPFGITTFPRPRLLTYLKVQEDERPNPRPLDFKGVVMEVLGPKCNASPGTISVEHTRDMLYTMAENSWLSQLWLSARTCVYALERDSNRGSTPAISVEAIKRKRCLF